MDTPLHNDIFISYCRADIDRVRPFVDALGREFRLWWDQELDRGDWGDQIESELAASRHVLVFISAAAMKSGYVHAEAKRASNAERLIPIRLDRQPLNLRWDGLCGRWQQYVFEAPFDPTAPDFVKLRRALGARPTARDAESPSPRDDAQSWFEKEPSIPDASFCLALATLENAPYAIVEQAARLLEDTLTPPSPANASPPASLRYLNPRARRLASVGAECFASAQERLGGIAVECVRFKETARAPQILDYAWRELDGMRGPLCDWLDRLAAEPARDLRLRAGVAVGKLAQLDFPLVFDRLIRPWAMDDDEDRRETADIVMSIAVFAAANVKVAERILDDWARSSGTSAAQRAAIEFATGYTGARVPGVGLPLIRRLVRGVGSQPMREVLEQVVRAVRRLVGRALSDADASLWDVDSLLNGIAEWVEAAARDEDPVVPIYIFLASVITLPLLGGGVDDRLSLEGLWRSDVSLAACIRVFARALSIAEAREMVRDTVNQWIAERTAKPRGGDPLGEFAAALARGVLSARDHERVLFLFRHADGIGFPAAAIAKR